MVDVESKREGRELHSQIFLIRTLGRDLMKGVIHLWREVLPRTVDVGQRT